MQNIETQGAQRMLHGHMAMLLFSVLVAGSFSLGALAAPHVSPVTLTWLRFILGSFLMGAILIATGQRAQMALRAPWRFLILGSIFCAYFVLMFEGLKTAEPVSLAAIFTLTPFMAAGFAWPLLRQTTSRHVLIALTIGASGALWVIFRADVNALLSFNLGWGEMVFFLGCVLHALYVPLLRKLNRGEGAMAATFGVLCGGAIALGIYGWRDIIATDWAELPVIVWIVLGYLMVFATTTTFFLVSFASMRLPSSKVLAYTYLTPSWVILWELALGHSAPVWLVLGGVALTLVALGMLLKNDG